MFRSYLKIGYIDHSLFEHPNIATSDLHEDTVYVCQEYL